MLSLLRSRLPQGRRALVSTSPRGHRAFTVDVYPEQATSVRVFPSSLPSITYNHAPYQVPYLLGLALQDRLVRDRFDSRRAGKPPSFSDVLEPDEAVSLGRVARGDMLLLMTHRPVYTGGRSYAEEEALELVRRLTEGGIATEFVRTKRGGKVTYHGPGQLIAYPILDLREMKMSLGTYIRKLDSFLSHFLSTRFSLTLLPSRFTSFSSSSPSPSPLPYSSSSSDILVHPTRSIGHVGIYEQKGIVSHGFALNVFDDVSHWFERIRAVAAGVQAEDRHPPPPYEQTSLERELIRLDKQGVRPGGEGEAAVMVLEDLVPGLIEDFGAEFGRVMLPDMDVHWVPDAEANMDVVGEVVLSGRGKLEDDRFHRLVLNA